LRSRSTLFFVCIIVLLIAVGCGTNANEESTPTPESAFESPLSSPVEPTATPIASCLDLIEPVGNTVCGFMVRQADGQPVADRPVFLAEGLTTSDNSAVFAALDQNSAPQGITDANGMFFIVDVPANLYFVMIGDYPQPLMIKEPDNPANDLYVDWREEGGIVDLGVLTVTFPAQVP
jgi:hypothetical protein